MPGAKADLRPPAFSSGKPSGRFHAALGIVSPAQTQLVTIRRNNRVAYFCERGSAMKSPISKGLFYIRPFTLDGIQQNRYFNAKYLPANSHFANGMQNVTRL
jgi:hypothetical protein